MSVNKAKKPRQNRPAVNDCSLDCFSFGWAGGWPLLLKQSGVALSYVRHTLQSKYSRYLDCVMKSKKQKKKEKMCISPNCGLLCAVRVV